MNQNNYKKTSYNQPFIEQRADPYVYKHTDGMYYFTASVPEYDKIVMRGAKTIKELREAKEHTLWRKHKEASEYPYLGAGGSLSLWGMVYLLCSRRCCGCVGNPTVCAAL